MSSGVSTPCPPDHPLMKAWTTYQETDDFRNTLHWAKENIIITTRETAPEANRVNPEEQRDQRARGSLWAAFMAGFDAAGGKVAVD